MNNELTKKIKKYFPDLIFPQERKEDLKTIASGLEPYIAEYIAMLKFPGEGEMEDSEKNEMQNFIHKFYPTKTSKGKFMEKLRKERARVIGKVNIHHKEKPGDEGSKIVRTTSLNTLDLNRLDIEDEVIEEHGDSGLLHEGLWGLVDIGKNEEDEMVVKEIRPFEAKIDMQYIKKARGYFTLDEWMQLILHSCGWNKAGYPKKSHMYLLNRLIPLVVQNYHIMELGAKGTGKSYIFEHLSSRIRMASGNFTPAQLFVNRRTGELGLLARFDALILDEIQKIKFRPAVEVLSTLKNALETDLGEKSTINRDGVDPIETECSLVFLGNIDIDSGYPIEKDFLKNLSDFLDETAFLDRFGGIIPGWKIPAHEPKYMVNEGYAFGAHFFEKLLTLLKDDQSYLRFCKNKIDFGDVKGRDRKAVIRGASGFLRLLFPDKKVTDEEFKKYCVKPALESRQYIRDICYMRDSSYHSSPRIIEATVNSEEVVFPCMDFDKIWFEEVNSSTAQEIDDNFERIKDLISSGESQDIEFKSTYRVNLKSDDIDIDDKVIKSTLKTIAGFLNAEGGTLFIGVTDEGDIYGLEDDFSSLKDPDRFENNLTSNISNAMNKDVHKYISISFHDIENKKICKISCQPSKKPVYYKIDGDQDVFYVRTNNSTRKFNHQETGDYIRANWPDLN